MPSDFLSNLAARSLVKYSTEIWFRGLLLLFSFILLVLIFSPNGVRVKGEFILGKAPEASQLSANGPADPVSARIDQLIDTQHEKANSEIKMLQEQIDTWYHYKFILIGGMVALFLGYFGIWGQQGTTPPKTSEKSLIDTLRSNRTSVLLALVCIVAFVIDMHIRTHLTNMQGLGYWVYNFVEPAYFRVTDMQTGHIPREALEKRQYFPWETFIHTNTREIQQTSPLYRAAYSFQLHFMTMIIYMLYLIVFQNVCLLCKGRKQRQVTFLGFIMVHIAALAFIMVGHTIPNSFDVKCFPISHEDCWLTGAQGSRYYFIVWFLLVISSLPYLYLLLSRGRSIKTSAAVVPGEPEKTMQSA